MSKISIIIPVFNEHDTLESVISSVQQSPCFGIEKEIIIVDDFSTDGTRDVLKKEEAGKWRDLKILFNDKNMGKGYSLRKGLQEATGEFTIIQDADLEYDPNEYEKLLFPLRSGADVVYGSRFLGRPFIWKTYYLANRFLTLLSNIFTNFQLTDMETCYKCFSRKALSQVLPQLTANRFDIEPEITSVIARSGFSIREVAISYNRRSYAEGKKIGFKDGLQAIWTIIKNF
jgi:glycosyltransferase involved in cell wall biosynthesis